MWFVWMSASLKLPRSKSKKQKNDLGQSSFLLVKRRMDKSQELLRKEAHELLNMVVHEPSSIMVEHFANKMKMCINGDIEGYFEIMKNQTNHLYHMYRNAETGRQEAMKKVEELAIKVDEQKEKIRLLEIELLRRSIELRKAPQLK